MDFVTAIAVYPSLECAEPNGTPDSGQPASKVHGTVHADDDYTPPPPTLQGLDKRADVIVDCTVQSIFPSRLRDVNDPGSVETDVLFAVDRVFKDKPEELRSLVITQAGGKYGDVEVIVDNTTPLKVGDRHILFLLHNSRTFVPVYPRTDGNFAIVGGFGGNFKVDGNAVKWLAPPDARTFRKFETGTAEDFITQILAEVSAAQ